MRCIDADALEKEGWSLHRTIQVDKNTSEYQIKQLKQVQTIEPEREKGEWLHPYRSDVACECSVCHVQMPVTDDFKFCPNCGAEMIDTMTYPQVDGVTPSVI